jgi:isopentenyl phosphate kinase
MKNELILIKLGGSLITDKSKPFTLRKEVLKRICKEIHEARKERKLSLIIGHGGGSFPHTSAAKYQTQKGYINKKSKKGFSLVQNDASKLNRLVVHELINSEENAVSVQPSSSCIADKGRIVKWDLEVINKMVKDDYIPVVFGDTSLDKTKGCCILSTEEILSYLARKLGGKKIILAGKVDGALYTNGKLINEITPKNFGKIKKYLYGSDGTDVTGGMVLKVGLMLELTKKGIKSIIINGMVKGNLKNALLDKKVKGTVIHK